MRKFLITMLLIAALFLISADSFGQVSVAPFQSPHVQFFGSDGKPLAGGKVYTYQAGTTTPLATYENASGSPNTNPIVLDAGGFANIWLGTNSYKFVLKNAAGVTQWTVDNISSLAEVAYISRANTFTQKQTMSGGITGLPDPSTSSDAVNKSYADADREEVSSRFTTVQDGLNALVTRYGGGTLKIPAGVKHTFSTLTWRKGTNIICSGTSVAAIAGGSEFLQTSGANTDFIVSDPDIPTTDDQHWSIMRNCVLRATPGASVTGNGITFNSRTGEGQMLDHIFVEDFPGDGIRLNHGSQPLFWQNIHVFRSGGYGINMTKTGADPWAQATIQHISGDDNASGMVYVSLGSGSGQAASNVDGLRFTDIKSETHTAGKQQNVFTFNDMNGTNVVVEGVTAWASVSANAVFKLTGTSTPVIKAGGIGADCTHFAYLVDDQVHGVQIPCIPAASLRYRWPDGIEIDHVKLYWTGTGALDAAGIIGRRVDDSLNNYRWKFGDFLTFCDGAGKDDTHCDARFRRSGANTFTFDAPTGTKSTIHVGAVNATSVNISGFGATGKAACVKGDKTLGYCSTQPTATGDCTCN